MIALPESDFGGLPGEGLAKIETRLAKIDAVLVGPGLQDAAATRAFTRRLLKRTGRAAIVLDALAMDVVFDVRRFERAPLLTPHAGEMAHLTGLAKEDVDADPERHAREAALRWNAVVALKGRDTVSRRPTATAGATSAARPGSARRARATCWPGSSSAWPRAARRSRKRRHGESRCTRARGARSRSGSGRSATSPASSQPRFRV